MIAGFGPQAFIIIAIMVIYYFRKEFSAFFHNRVVEATPISRDQYLLYHKFLNARMEYYQNLSMAGQAKFINRIHRFIASKRFIGREGQVITEEIKVLIAGAAVQLTFGLDKFVLQHYHTIMIYPREFHSRLLRKNLKGGTMVQGTMLFSWEDFKDGYADEHDGINLGLHEMAHALKFDVTYGDRNFDTHFANYIENWESAGYRAFRALRKGELDFLRKYGGTNMDEFFSVCVEFFFEVPEEFRIKLPTLYAYMVRTLKQNPANKEIDYKLYQQPKEKGFFKDW